MIFIGSIGDRNYTMTILRPHKNSSQKQTFEMPGGETEYVRQSTTHETYRLQTPASKKPLNDKGSSVFIYDHSYKENFSFEPIRITPLNKRVKR